MISFDKALRSILENCESLPLEERSLLDALGAGLSEPLYALLDNPAFDNSAVDGYGTRAGARGRLAISGVSVAGGSLPSPVIEGQAVRILTGAPVPDGVQTVVMQEDTEVEDEHVQIIEPGLAFQHIRRRGEDYRTGQELLKVGTEITSSVLALLAANGIESVQVPRRPKVSIVITGDELVPPGSERGPHQIFESNGTGLTAAASESGSLVVERSLAKDEPAMLEAAFRSGLATADVLVIAGGMSVGDRDHAREVLKSMGMREHFWRIKMRPGKPVLFGSFGEKLVFGLPGNPVSALVTFHLLVRPALRRLAGIQLPEPRITARLAHQVTKALGRTDFQRGLLSWDSQGPTVSLLDGQGSHLAGGLAVADCLVELPEDKEQLAAGTLTRILLLK